MKGIVFTEFLDMVSHKFGPDVVDDLIESANLPHGGAYTSVGTYPHAEMVSLVQALSNHTGLHLQVLLETFGRHLFGRFYAKFPHFMHQVQDPLDFLLGVEAVVHDEVKKLYPDAQLPSFATQRLSADQIAMIYRSHHDFSALALGLIRGCGDHYAADLEVETSDPQLVDEWVEVNFKVTRRDHS
jgi:hypothetical protein